MPDFLRVRVKDTGHEISIRKDRYDEAVYTKTDKDALGPDGLPLAPKFKTTVDKSAAAKKATPGQQAESKKENS